MTDTTTSRLQRIEEAAEEVCAIFHNNRVGVDVCHPVAGWKLTKLWEALRSYEPPSQTTDQLIRGAIDETRELVAALPQELFDLRKENAALRAQLTAARELRSRLTMQHNKETGRISYTVTQCAVAEFDSVVGGAG